MEDFWVIGIAIFQFVCGWIAAEIAGRKGRSFGGFFLLGFLLGLLGIAIAAIVSGTSAASARTSTTRPASRSTGTKPAQKPTGKREDWREWLGKS